MLDGWYCRSIANMQAENKTVAQIPQNDDDPTSESSQSEAEQINYKDRYKNLKKKLKYLIYENECFQEALHTSQRKLLKACRDRSFLLDRLLQYEKPEPSSSDSDDTDSSEDDDTHKTNIPKKRRLDQPTSSNVSNLYGAATHVTHVVREKVRKKPSPQKKTALTSVQPFQVANTKSLSLTSDGNMTPEEVERHLQSRQSILELVPERAPPTVPTEMFSNEPSLDSESNDILEMSPSNVHEEWVE